MNEPRPFKIFIEAIKTDATKKAYVYWLKKYMEFRQISEYTELLQADLKTVQTQIEDYLIHLKEKATPKGTIEAMIYPLFLFYQMNDYSINTLKIKKLFPAPIKKVGGAAYDTKHVSKILVTLGRKQKLRILRNKAIIHFVAASGCRVGAIPDLKFADVVKSKSRYYIKIYAGTPAEYITFLTKEASDCLTKYLEKRLKDNGPINPTDSLFDIRYDAVRAMITRLVKKAKVVTKQENGRFDIPAAHGLRKRWNTTLKSTTANPVLVEKIFGHNVIALDENYLKPTPERLLQEYKKGERDLTIFRHRLPSSKQISE